LVIEKQWEFNFILKKSVLQKFETGVIGKKLGYVGE